MKQHYGSWLVRLLRGGAMLSSGEFKLLSMLVAELPLHLRSVAEAQFAEYNLVQREADGRALNFYKVGVLSKAPLPVLPRDEAPLVRITMHTAERAPLHATLTAVRGRVFCVSFSRAVPEAFENEAQVSRVVHSWESTSRPTVSPNPSIERTCL